MALIGPAMRQTAREVSGTRQLQNRQVTEFTVRGKPDAVAIQTEGCLTRSDKAHSTLAIGETHIRWPGGRADRDRKLAPAADDPSRV